MDEEPPDGSRCDLRWACVTRVAILAQRRALRTVNLSSESSPGGSQAAPVRRGHRLCCDRFCFCEGPLFSLTQLPSWCHGDRKPN